MFRKTERKAIVHFKYEDEGLSGEMTTVPLKDGSLLDYLKNAFHRHGTLVIKGINALNEMELTTSRTVEHTNTENRIEEIAEFIRDYVKNRAVEMDAHAVLADGELKGVFGLKSHAELKKQALVRQGCNIDAVQVLPIKINRF